MSEITLNESIAMFEISRSVKPWDHLKDEVVAPMLEAARLAADPNIQAVGNELVRLDVIASPSVARDLAFLLVAAALTSGEPDER